MESPEASSVDWFEFEDGEIATKDIYVFNLPYRDIELLEIAFLIYPSKYINVKYNITEHRGNIACELLEECKIDYIIMNVVYKRGEINVEYIQKNVHV